MKVTVDTGRIAHLVLLVVGSYLFGKYLVEHWDMSNLSGYGLGCYLVCQANSVLTRVWQSSSNSNGNGRNSKSPSRAADRFIPNRYIFELLPPK